MSEGPVETCQATFIGILVYQRSYAQQVAASHGQVWQVEDGVSLPAEKLWFLAISLRSFAPSTGFHLHWMCMPSRCEDARSKSTTTSWNKVTKRMHQPQRQKLDTPPTQVTWIWYSCTLLHSEECLNICVDI